MSDNIEPVINVKPSHPKAVDNQKQIILEHTTNITSKSANSNVKVVSSSPTRLLGTELSKRINSSKDLRILIKEAEKIMNKMLVATDVSILVSIYDFGGVPADIIIMGVEYCVKIGKPNMRAIEKTIYHWMDMGLNSHDKINDYITYCTALKSTENEVRRIFGTLDRALTSNQKKYIETLSLIHISEPTRH